MTITVYGRPGCGQCEQTQKQLERKGLKFNVINIDEDAAARTMVERSVEQLRPAAALPMVVVSGHPKRGDATTWHGFRYDKIKELTKDS